MAESDSLDALKPFGAARRFLRIHVEGQPGLLVERMRGRESINEGCRFDVLCLSRSASIDPRLLIGKPTSLHIATADGSRRRWHGHVTRAASLGADGGFARYRLRLESALAFLKQRRNTLIFQDRTALEVIERVFGNYSELRWRSAVSAELRTRPICTQHRESDFSFVTRLLAEEGLSYRIEHEQEAHGRAPGHIVVVFDRDASLAMPAGNPSQVRFHRADATEDADAITAFAERLRVTSDVMTASSWAAAQVQAVAASASTPYDGDRPGLPVLERFDAGRAHAFDRTNQARRYAQHQLDAMRAGARRFRGEGSQRTLSPGARYTLTAHPTLSGQAFVVLSVEHRATNNLRPFAGTTVLADEDGIAGGSYRNRFAAVPAGVPIAPRFSYKPTAAGCQAATVVGTRGESLTSTRDHQVRVQFHWQRGKTPLPGGLTDTGSRADQAGHAPADASSGTWVRVAEALAGANYGHSFIPRIGDEVLVGFDAGDIDRPVIIGSLYNASAPPPFATGAEGDAQHRAAVSGIRTRDIRGGPSACWTLDDAAGQLGQRLSHSLADSRLELGQVPGSPRRSGDGEGFRLATQGWTAIRSGEGLLLSSATRSAARSTQMDARGAVDQLKAAHAAAVRMREAADATAALAPGTGAAVQKLTGVISPAENAKYHGPVGGQASTRPQGDRRSGGEPVERFDQPALLLESPASIAVTTGGSTASFAGGGQHLAARHDAHLAAGATVSAASGGATGLYVEEGGMKIVANRGPVRVRAAMSRMQIIANQDVHVTSTTERIDVIARNRIVLRADGATVTLDGTDLSFACPGNFTVRSATHRWLDGEAQPAAPSDATDHALPRGNDARASIAKTGTRRRSDDGANE
ncbi:MAG TPA: type VI secretion system tip protein TssI/VgrG [Nevskiaceae bacterium]